MSRKRRHQSEKHQENINITDENAFEDISGEEQTEEEVPDEYEDAEDEQDNTVKNTEDEDIRSRKKVKRRRRGARKGVKKQAKKSMGKKPWIIAGSIIGALVVIYLGIAAFFMSHFLVNTSINGKDFSGKTVADVEAYLKEQVADYELTILEQNNVSDVITGSEISLAYKENSRVQDALENQRQLLWLISLFSESDTDITIEVEYDDAALEENIQNLQAVTAEQVDPVAAHPEYDGNSFVTYRPSQKGGIALGDHRIRDLVEDKNGFLWIATSAEVYSCYDLQRECFVDFTGCGEYRELYSDKIIDRNGNVWLWLNGNGCRKVTYADGQFSSIVFKTEKNNLPSNKVTYVYEDLQGGVWIGTDNGVVQVIGDRTVLVVPSHRASKIISDGGNLFFLSADGRFVVKKREEECKYVARLQESGIRIVEELLFEVDWVILTNKGCYVFNFKTF